MDEKVAESSGHRLRGVAEERAAVRARLAADAAQLRACQALLFRWFDEGLVDIHDDGCPGDDTCACAEAAELNACLKGMTP
jgi:hypothetical protein